MATAEDVERQIAIAAIVAVEKAPLLMAVHGVVGGVQVEDDTAGRAIVRLDKQIDEKIGQSRGVMGDLVIARIAGGRRLLQPVQRGLARQNRTVGALGLEPLRQKPQDRIMAQLVVVVDVLVAQGQADNALAHQGAQRMDQLIRRPAVVKACGNPLEQSKGPVGLAQQQAAGIRRNRAAVKPGHDTALAEAFKLELR